MESKTVLITGASSGFGQLALLPLLHRGHTVIAGMRGGEARLKVLFPAEQLQKFGSRLRAIDLHMEKPESIQATADLIEREYGGKLDVLINNAGYGLFGAIEDQSQKELRYQFEVNFFGPVGLIQITLPFLRRSRGRIINVSSIAGLMTMPLYGSYSATKFAIEGMTEALSYDLMPHGVQVAMIEPGGFRTDFSVRSRLTPEKSKNLSSPYFERTRALGDFLNQTEFRLADPLKVANLMVKLVEKRKIHLRYPVGADARFMIALKRILPDRVRVALTEFALRKVMFKE